MSTTYDRTFFVHGLREALDFWFPACVDEKFGGFNTSLDRFGNVINPDKSVWFQGRSAWTLAMAYRDFFPEPQFLDWARAGLEFLERRCFDSDGRMFFTVTEDGKPLRKRRYVFSECFAILAMAAFAQASGESAWRDRAWEIFQFTNRCLNEPGVLEPKVSPETRPMRGLGTPMILLNVASELRRAFQDGTSEGSVRISELNQIIDGYLHDIETFHWKPEFDCLLETVGENGEFLDTFDGRQINPGHSMEAAWFTLAEARFRENDTHLKELGLKILNASWRWGWDAKFGGMLYFRDCRNLPCTEYWHDMKFWWPHCETLIAQLMAWHMTGENTYRERFEQTADWTFSHFPDPRPDGGGEWFGYPHRDGTLSVDLKGNLFKGPFHIPRMFAVCAGLESSPTF